MKSIVLIDSSKCVFDRLKEIATNNCEGVYLIDTTVTSKNIEYQVLSDGISEFMKTDTEIMLARFSGSESIVRNLGEESPEMIVSLSDGVESSAYTENPEKTLLDLINIFEYKETK